MAGGSQKFLIILVFLNIVISLTSGLSGNAETFDWGNITQHTDELSNIKNDLKDEDDTGGNAFTNWVTQVSQRVTDSPFFIPIKVTQTIGSLLFEGMNPFPTSDMSSLDTLERTAIYGLSIFHAFVWLLIIVEIIMIFFIKRGS